MTDLPAAVTQKLSRLSGNQGIDPATLKETLFKIACDHDVSVARLKRELGIIPAIPVSGLEVDEQVVLPKPKSSRVRASEGLDANVLAVSQELHDIILDRLKSILLSHGLAVHLNDARVCGKLDRAAKILHESVIRYRSDFTHKKGTVFLGGEFLNFSGKFNENLAALQAQIKATASPDKNGEKEELVTAAKWLFACLRSPRLFRTPTNTVTKNLSNIEAWFKHQDSASSLEDALQFCFKAPDWFYRNTDGLKRNFDGCAKGLLTYGVTNKQWFEAIKRSPGTLVFKPATVIVHYELQIALHEICGSERRLHGEILHNTHPLQWMDESFILRILGRQLEVLTGRATGQRKDKDLTFLNLDKKIAYEKRVLDCLLYDTSFAEYQAWLTQQNSHKQGLVLAPSDKDREFGKQVLDVVVKEVTHDIRARHGKVKTGRLEEIGVVSDRFTPQPAIAKAARLPDIIMQDVKDFDFKNKNHRFEMMWRLHFMGVVKESMKAAA